MVRHRRSVQVQSERTGDYRGATFRALLGVALIATLGASGWVRAVMLAWDPSPSPDVVGYELHVGTEPGTYGYVIDVGAVTGHPLPPLTAGVTHYFAVSAYASDGRRSGFSNEVAYLASEVDALAPTVRIVASPASGHAPLTVRLSSEASGAIAWYRWDFGDGTSHLGDALAALAGIEHTYALPGAYTVRLTASGPRGTFYSRQSALVKVVGSGSGCPCSLFGAAAPALSDAGPSEPINVGLRFKVLRDGAITALRIYRGPANLAGTRSGSLWSSDGRLLATLELPSALRAGWQEATFGAPVSVAAGQTLVASYHAPAGSHARDDGAFLRGFVNGPLQVPANRAGVGNGVFAFGPASTFPDQGSKAADYGVDVTFVPAAGAQPSRGRIQRDRAQEATSGTRGGARSQPSATPTTPASMSRSSKVR